MDIIRKTNTKRAILVTSHYSEAKVHKLALKRGKKILPQQLASEVSIQVR
jgi:molybdopterin-binding protein